MPEPRPSDEQLRRFLLGQLSEADREPIERAALDSSSELFAEVSALEDELRAAYAQGRLTGAERAAFEDRYLVTAADRSKQAFMAALASRADAGSARHVAPDRLQTSEPWSRRPIWLGLAAAAAVVLAVAAVMFAARAASLQRALDNAQADFTQREQQLRQASERQLAEATARAAANPVLAVFLMPGLTRAGGGDVPRLSEREVATGVRATLNFPPTHDPAARYRVVVRDPDGRTLWSSPDLTAAGRSVTTTVPGGTLRRGDYEVLLQAGAGRGGWSDVASYYLRVVTP